MPSLTVTEIAARLGVHKSTVSRQARAAGLMGADKRIDLAAYESLRANGLDPALQTTGTAPAPEAESGTLAIERTRKMAADAARAELELDVRRGELIARSTVATVLGPAARRLRDRLIQVPRDTIREDAERLACETGITDAIEAFSLEVLSNGASAAA